MVRVEQEVLASAQYGAIRAMLLIADESVGHLDGYASHGLNQLQVARLADGTPVGVAIWGPIEPGVAEVFNLAVRPDHQGRGVGSQLLGTVCDQATAEHVSEVRLGTGNSDPRVLLFYQRAGFRITGIQPDYFRRHYETRIYENGIECRDRIDLRWRPANPDFNTQLSPPTPESD